MELASLVLYFFKTEPLGTYFKTVACYATTDFLLIEIQKIKDGTKNSKYDMQIGATEAYTKKIV